MFEGRGQRRPLFREETLLPEFRPGLTCEEFHFDSSNNRLRFLFDVRLLEFAHR